ncbi:MAG: hypothetical protein JXB19_01805 [Bacteroidales bacterium]|nr:hypothetical protein [Bacteroidales bacterium]
MAKLKNKYAHSAWLNDEWDGDFPDKLDDAPPKKSELDKIRESRLWAFDKGVEINMHCFGTFIDQVIEKLDPKDVKEFLNSQLEELEQERVKNIRHWNNALLQKNVDFVKGSDYRKIRDLVDSEIVRIQGNAQPIKLNINFQMHLLRAKIQFIKNYFKIEKLGISSKLYSIGLASHLSQIGYFDQSEVNHFLLWLKGQKPQNLIVIKKPANHFISVIAELWDLGCLINAKDIYTLQREKIINQKFLIQYFSESFLFPDGPSKPGYIGKIFKTANRIKDNTLNIKEFIV